METKGEITILFRKHQRLIAYLLIAIAYLIEVTFSLIGKESIISVASVTILALTGGIHRM